MTDQLPDGIYFDLPDADYHGQQRLSSSGIKTLMNDPTRFWRESWMCADFETEETPAKRFGTAVHKSVLEGVDAFNDAYAAPFVAEAEWLTTNDELKAECERHGLTKTGKKEDLIARLQDSGAALSAPITELKRQEWADGNEGKIELPASTYELAAHLGKIVRDKTPFAKLFEGARNEVSILWTEALPDGQTVPMKARLDSLHPNRITDLKTFSNSRGQRPWDLINSQVATYGYHLQAETYLMAREQIPTLVKAGKVNGDVQSLWLQSVASKPTTPFVWLFVESVAYPNIAPLTYRPESGAIGERNRQILRGIMAIFSKYRETYGEGMWLNIPDPQTSIFDIDYIKPWHEPDPAILELAA